MLKHKRLNQKIKHTFGTSDAGGYGVRVDTIFPKTWRCSSANPAVVVVVLFIVAIMMIMKLGIVIIICRMLLFLVIGGIVIICDDVDVGMWRAVGFTGEANAGPIGGGAWESSGCLLRVVQFGDATTHREEPKDDDGVATAATTEKWNGAPEFCLCPFEIQKSNIQNKTNEREIRVKK